MRSCWWRLRGTGGNVSRAAAAAEVTVGGGAGAFLPRGRGWARLSIERCGGTEGRGSRGRTRTRGKHLLDGILFSFPPPPAPGPSLSSSFLRSPSSPPFASVSAFRGRGESGVGPASLPAPLALGARIQLRDLGIKMQDAS